jgi:hypothetical protein
MKPTEPKTDSRSAFTLKPRSEEEMDYVMMAGSRADRAWLDAHPNRKIYEGDHDMDPERAKAISNGEAQARREWKEMTPEQRKAAFDGE